MTEGTALVDIGISHELAEDSGKRPAPFFKEARGSGERNDSLRGTLDEWLSYRNKVRRWL